jgi:DUF4097 and DUF4098 domain-containing protein YvlB
MKTTLKGLLLIAILAGSVSWLSCDSPASADRGDFTAGEPFSFEIAAPGHTGLRLAGVAGNVTITGSSQTDSVLISGERRVSSDWQEDAETLLRDLEVRIDDGGGEIFVETVQPRNGRGRNYVVDYRITIPWDFEIHVGNVSGNVELRQTKGNATVNVVSGRIEAEATLPPHGILDLSSTSGGIDLEIPRSTSAEFHANVTSGTINLSNLSLRNERHSPTSIQGTLGDGQGLISLEVTSGHVLVEGT